MEIQESVAHIRQVMDWFPGSLLAVKRQMGKTTAILEAIHERHIGLAILYAPSPDAAAFAEQRYRQLYPSDFVPLITSNSMHVRGRNLPIYIDEWWRIPEADRRSLMQTGKVHFRIGTEFGY